MSDLELRNVKPPTLYRAEVIADNSGKYCGNGLTFNTVSEAADYARNLISRWTLVSSWRVVSGDKDTPKIHRMFGE